ncbi:hypothetical protein SCHPADRAFT_975816 [Schizopora paradoxa]|uniref:Uncharacterized protein n=1 Tax=Schizopora paradoxa TaxID=27342 RepID=A0A0H2RGV6_9AGAM|nr:hypothetical protein SCHPADRAFT_975816 [Schizopora paradoxa]
MLSPSLTMKRGAQFTFKAFWMSDYLQHLEDLRQLDEEREKMRAWRYCRIPGDENEMRTIQDRQRLRHPLRSKVQSRGVVDIRALEAMVWSPPYFEIDELQEMDEDNETLIAQEQYRKGYQLETKFADENSHIIHYDGHSKSQNTSSSLTANAICEDQQIIQQDSMISSVDSEHYSLPSNTIDASPKFFNSSYHPQYGNGDVLGDAKTSSNSGLLSNLSSSSRSVYDVNSPRTSTWSNEIRVDSGNNGALPPVENVHEAPMISLHELFLRDEREKAKKRKDLQSHPFFGSDNSTQ